MGRRETLAAGMDTGPIGAAAAELKGRSKSAPRDTARRKKCKRRKNKNCKPAARNGESEHGNKHSQQQTRTNVERRRPKERNRRWKEKAVEVKKTAEIWFSGSDEGTYREITTCNCPGTSANRGTTSPQSPTDPPSTACLAATLPPAATMEFAPQYLPGITTRVHNVSKVR